MKERCCEHVQERFAHHRLRSFPDLNVPRLPTLYGLDVPLDVLQAAANRILIHFVRGADSLFSVEADYEP